MNSSKVLLGVLGGVAVGAIVGVLLAPDKGSNTRRKILDTGKDYADDLKGKLENLSKEVTNKYESYVGQSKDGVSNQIK